MYRAYHTQYIAGIGYGPKLFFDSSLSLPQYQIIDPVLSKAFGRAGSFSFKVSMSNDQYDTFKELISYIDIYREKTLIFSARVLSIEKDFNNICSINCEGLYSLFNDSIAQPGVMNCKTLKSALKWIINDHNKQVDPYKQIFLGNIEEEEGIFYQEYTTYEDTEDRLENFTQTYGGYFVVRRNTDRKIFLDYYKDHTRVFVSGNEQEINFAENLLSIDQSTNADEIASRIYAIGADKKDKNGNYISTVSAVVDNNSAISAYGIISKVVEWPDVSDLKTLKKLATSYLKTVNAPMLTINVGAVDLAKAGSNIQFFDVGQRVRVKSKLHNINDVMLIQEQQINLLDPASNSMTLGTEKKGYVSTTKNTSLGIYNILNRKIAKTQRSIYDITDEDIREIIGDLS